jgi:hypothetical protein
VNLYGGGRNSGPDVGNKMDFIQFFDKEEMYKTILQDIVKYDLPRMVCP